MCGICGKLNYDPQEPVEPALLQQMMDVLRHRGPDGEGEYRHGPVGLGHRRLSIIDLSTGDQPMCNEDGTVWVVYNGEIYNFQDLRADLQSLGHTFKSKSDTEVIVHLYEQFGPSGVRQLRGMFAFALWDQRKQLLLLARDRVGIKPLYYAVTGKGIVFASELKSVLCDPAVPRLVNPNAIDRFLTYYYLPGSETLFKGIHRLEPGHYLTVSKGQVTVKQYWDLSFDSPATVPTFADAVDSLRTLLQRTVKDHMISDVPVGILLSGGVDSTGILAFAAKQASQPIHSFTIGFAGESFPDERPYARLAADRFATQHHDITIDAKDFCDFLPNYIWHMEDPVCEPPAVSLYYVARLARQASVKVLLSGEGGDEAFGGYQNYRTYTLLEGLKSALGPAAPLLRPSLTAFGRLAWPRVRPYGALADTPLSDYYLSRTATPHTPFNRLKCLLYADDFRATLEDGEPDDVTRSLFARLQGYPPLHRMLYVDTKTWLPDDLLVKADKMTMATSVELRVPLLDAQVLEFAASLPPRYKVRGWSGKRILKAVLRDSVPHQILHRKKTGFPLPYDRWLRTDLKEFLLDTVLGPGTSLTTYFRKDTLNDLVTRFQRDGAGAKELFSLAILELWHRAFLTGGPLSAPPAPRWTQ